MAASDRGNAYSAPDPCSESLEKMTKRLTSDLRARVRRLANYPPLSPEWIEMADTLQHLASVAMMEEKDSAKKVFFPSAKRNAQHGTGGDTSNDV